MAKTTGLASISEGSSDLLKIDPRKLNVRPDWNARDWNLQENKDHVEMLAQSIAAVGVKQPLTVKWQDNKAYIDDGECRYRAVMLCIERGVPIKTVPCRAADHLANEVDRRFNRYLANTGKQFNQLETAKDWKWFLDQGWSQKDIAAKAGISQGRVSQILELLTLPEGAKAIINNGQASTSFVAKVVKEHGSDAEKVLKEGLEKAKAEGKSKIKPEHVVSEPKVNIKKAVREAFEYSHVDDENDEFVVIKMPVEQFEIIRKLCEL